MSPFGARDGSLLLLMPSWVGDVVMATPAVRAFSLAARAEGRVVDALVRPGSAPLLDGLSDADGTPLLDSVIEVDLRGIAGLLRGTRQLRARRAAAAVLLPNSFRTALAACLAGIPHRLGYATDGRGLLLGRGIRRAKPRDPISTVDWYADLAEGLLGTMVGDRRPFLTVTAAQRTAAHSLVGSLDRRFVLLNPGANRIDKRWPAGNFARLAVALRNRFDVEVAVTGSPAESKVVSEVVAACPGAVNLVDRGIDLAALKGVIASASLLVSNDTGPRHIALALGTPTVSLFGPTDHRWTTIEGADERRLVAEPFLPVEECADRRAAHCAIDRIAVGDAIAAAAAILRLEDNRVSV